MQALMVRMAESTWNVYRQVLAGGKGVAGDTALSWGELSHLVKEEWLRGIKQAWPAIPGLEGMKFEDVARQVFRLWASRAGIEVGGEVFDGLTVRDRLAWEAVVRHLSWLMDGGEPVSWEEAESAWKEWADRKLRAHVIEVAN